ncbi:hypothetical protein BaRGS_00012685 [Batillaria attramentaria]|uniref:Uncharacterized protein n=1 Tax=Batillaria attramentaria TaxID=370345 RepID=A0ABD0LA21_9CAEN
MISISRAILSYPQDDDSEAELIPPFYRLQRATSTQGADMLQCRCGLDVHSSNFTPPARVRALVEHGWVFPTLQSSQYLEPTGTSLPSGHAHLRTKDAELRSGSSDLDSSQKNSQQGVCYLVNSHPTTATIKLFPTGPIPSGHLVPEVSSLYSNLQPGNSCLDNSRPKTIIMYPDNCYPKTNPSRPVSTWTASWQSPTQTASTL